MIRHIVIVSLVLVVSTGLAPRAISQDDIEQTLSRAQALYYEARFKDSIELLLPVDAALRDRADRAGLSISVKLQLALSYIGQNQIDEAKSVFQEVFLLDPEYVLDPNQFAPKVLALFDDARAEQKKTRCQKFCTELDRLAKTGDVQALLRLAKEAGAGCVCAAAADAAELLYKQGLDAYKRDEFSEALHRFRAAIQFRPGYDLAIQYAELAEGKIKLAMERMVLDWRRYFEAQDFPKATSLYRQLESLNPDGKGDAALEQIRNEYRKTVRVRIESWSENCSTDASLSLDALRQQVKDLLPDQTIAAELVSTLSPCASKTTETRAAPAQGCLQMTSQLALVRLKTRVDPDIRPDRAPVSTVNIRAKIKIDEAGNVTVQELVGANPYITQAMRVALEKWKFLPAIFQGQRRCVESELPIVLGRS